MGDRLKGRGAIVAGAGAGGAAPVSPPPPRGPYNTPKPACGYFRQERKGGVIINTSSTSGLGNVGQANYAAAKEGIVGFPRTLARAMGRYGVRCNAIRP